MKLNCSSPEQCEHLKLYAAVLQSVSLLIAVAFRIKIVQYFSFRAH